MHVIDHLSEVAASRSSRPPTITEVRRPSSPPPSAAEGSTYPASELYVLLEIGLSFSPAILVEPNGFTRQCRLPTYGVPLILVGGVDTGMSNIFWKDVD